MYKMFVIIGAIACLMLCSNMAHAQSDLVLDVNEPHTVRVSSTKGPFYSESKAEKRARKLARGLGNMIFGIGEVPNQMFREAYETSPVTGSFVGFFKGLGKGVARIGIGFVETITFFDDGNNNFEPIIYPEQVFMEDNH